MERSRYIVHTIKENDDGTRYYSSTSVVELPDPSVGSDPSLDYGWEIAPQGDELPLSSVLAERVRDPEGEELEWAARKARELGLP